MTETKSSATVIEPPVLEPKTDPKVLKRWLETLPLLNPATTVSSVLGSCKQYNSLDLPAKRRFQYLSIYRRQALTFADQFETAPFQRALEPSRTAEVAQNIGALLIETQVGYNRVVRAATSRSEKPVPWSAGDPWAFATFAALQLAGISMLHSYRANMPLVPGLFREMNYLYRVADAHAATHHPIPKKLARLPEGISSTNVAHLFKAIALFHLSDPFSYSPSELTPGFESCICHADAARIGKAHPDSQGPNAQVDLAGTKPPVALAGAARDRSSEQSADGQEHIRFIDLAPVQRSLQRAIQNHSETMESKRNWKHARHLLGRMRKIEPVGQSAGSNDTSVNLREVPIRAAIGLDSIYHFLKDDGRRLNEALKDAGDTMQIRLKTKDGRVVAHKLETWLLSNHKRRGYRLRQPGIGRIDAESGELVGLTNAKQGIAPKLDLGLITWARHDEQDRLHIGIRPLSKGVAPATCTSDWGNTDESSTVQCLHVSREKNPTGGALLFAPIDTAWENTQVMLDVEGTTRVVEVGSRRTDVASLACYELSA